MGWRPGSRRAAEGWSDIALVGLMRDCLLRRSEAADARWSHLTSHADGTGRLLVGVSKTDQEGRGRVAVRQQPYDGATSPPSGPKRAEDRPVFDLHPRTIGRRIAAAARAAGEVGGLQWTQRARRHGEGPRARRRGAARAHDGGALEGAGDGRRATSPTSAPGVARSPGTTGSPRLDGAPESF